MTCRLLLFFVLTLPFWLAGCEEKRHSTANLRFTNTTLCPCTPVKDQGQSCAGWIYAMLATIESEHIIDGDSVNLSPEYVVFRYLQDRTRNFYLNADADSISTCGTISMLPGLLSRNGAMPHDSYHSKADMGLVARKLSELARQHRLRHSGTDALMEATRALLEDAIAPVPPHVYMFGVQYTPEEFAHSVCRPNEYVFLTNQPSVPFHQPIALTSPDGNKGTPCVNIPADSLTAIVVRTLRSGHPVCWEGDVSGPDFDFQSGVARLDDDCEAGAYTKLQRSKTERLRPADVHCMELIGTARDREGRQYVVGKDSHGTANRHNGLVYMSLPYLRTKTVAVAVRRSSCPKGTRL